MEDKELCQHILGLATPWSIGDVKLDMELQQMGVWWGHLVGTQHFGGIWWGHSTLAVFGGDTALWR